MSHAWRYQTMRGSPLKKPKTTPLEKKLTSLQNRIDRIQAISNLLTKHPFLAALSDLKATSGGLVGLVIDDKAFIRPQGVNKPGLRMEKWLEDSFMDEELQDRIVCDDVSALSTEALQELLATIPDTYDPDDIE
jgi:hypothetical protein